MVHKLRFQPLDYRAGLSMHKPNDQRKDDDMGAQKKASLSCRARIRSAQGRRQTPARISTWQFENRVASVSAMPVASANPLRAEGLDREVGERIGKDETAVSSRRYRLNVAAFVKRRPNRPAPECDALLGTMSDVDLTRRLHCSSMAVFYRRRKLRIPRFAENH